MIKRKAAPPLGTVHPGGEPKITIRIIGRCNFLCPSCSTFSSPERRGMVSIADFREIARSLAKERFNGVLNLSGGEPTLHPHLEDLLKMLQATLPEVRAVLFTNGSWVGAPGWKERLAGFLTNPKVLIRFSLDRQHIMGAARSQGKPPNRESLDTVKEKIFSQAEAFLSVCSRLGAQPAKQFDFAFKGTLDEAEAFLAPLGNVPVYPIVLQNDPSRRPKRLGYLAVDLDPRGRLRVYPTLGHIPREPLGGLKSLPTALQMNRRYLRSAATVEMDANDVSAVGLEVKITDRCNRRCWFCMNNDSPDKSGQLEMDGFLARLAQWFQNRRSSRVDIEELRITGGEPLLQLEDVMRISRLCREHGLRCGLNTNGTLLTHSNLVLLKDAGVSLLKVSLNAVADEIPAEAGAGPGGPVATPGVLAGAVQLGFTLITRFTLCRENQDQLLPCYELSRQLGARKYQVKPLVQAGRADKNAGALSRDAVTAAFKALAERATGSVAQPQVLCWPPELAAGLATKVCGSLNKIYVNSDLSVTTCNYLAPERPFATLAEQSFEDILRHRTAPVWTAHKGHRLLAGCPQQCIFTSP